MITHVAIRFQDKVWSLPAPNRHHHVIRHIVETCEDVKYVDARDEDQGFLDEVGRYLNREQALGVAVEKGQLIRKTEPKHLLFSEDLW